MPPNRSPASIVRTALLVSLLLLAACAPAGLAAASTEQGQSNATTAEPTTQSWTTGATSTSTARTVDLTQTLRLTPETPGEITVTLQYSIPADVVELKTRVPSSATVTSTTGFVHREGTEYHWDRQTASPTLTYRMPVNQTRDATGPIAGKGDYIFVDPGPWALVRIPPTATGWGWTGAGTVGLTRTVTTAGPGATGDAIAFLGDHREVTRTAHGQTFRLVVPDRASLTESPSNILNSMVAASNAMQVGDRDERVFVVAAPTKTVNWGVRGLHTGDSDMWVRDTERLDTADNVWLHEYVHSRQGYTAAREVQWFTEASATYYAALLTLQQDRIGFNAFRDRLALGSRSPWASAVLADPASWDTVAPYTKGALVAGELDRRTRLATDRTRSLQDVFSRMNSHPDTVTSLTFREMVRQSGGESTAALAEQYTTTQEVPSMWDQQAHERAFATIPARIGYTFTGFRVSGPYREGAAGDARPIQLATGETLTIDVQVSNTGGATGEYDARLVVNGEQQTRQTGSLGPGESTTLTLTHQFTTAGEYTLDVGGDRVAVSVREPAKPTVTGIGTEVSDRTVTVTASVRNSHDFPAAATLTLVHNGEPVETKRVQMAPGAEQSVSFAGVTLQPGTHVFGVGDRTTTVTIAATPTPTETTGDGAGFGIASVVCALVGVVLLSRRG